MNKTKRINLIIFAVYIVGAQWYFTILSTHHALHNMPATCPVCALVNQFDNSAISETATISVGSIQLYLTLPSELSVLVYRFVSYDSRAPPSQIIKSHIYLGT